MKESQISALLEMAVDICSSILYLEIGSNSVRNSAREFLKIAEQFKRAVPEPGTLCGCGSGAVRLRDRLPFCYSCWMAMEAQRRFEVARSEIRVVRREKSGLG